MRRYERKGKFKSYYLRHSLDKSDNLFTRNSISLYLCFCSKSATSRFLSTFQQVNPMFILSLPRKKKQTLVNGKKHCSSCLGFWPITRACQSSACYTLPPIPPFFLEIFHPQVVAYMVWYSWYSTRGIYLQILEDPKVLFD